MLDKSPLSIREFVAADSGAQMIVLPVSSESVGGLEEKRLARGCGEAEVAAEAQMLVGRFSSELEELVGVVVESARRLLLTCEGLAQMLAETPLSDCGREGEDANVRIPIFPD